MPFSDVDTRKLAKPLTRMRRTLRHQPCAIRPQKQLFENAMDLLNTKSLGCPGNKHQGGGGHHPSQETSGTWTLIRGSHCATRKPVPFWATIVYVQFLTLNVQQILLLRHLVIKLIFLQQYFYKYKYTVTVINIILEKTHISFWKRTTDLPRQLRAQVVTHSYSSLLPPVGSYLLSSHHQAGEPECNIFLADCKRGWGLGGNTAPRGTPTAPSAQSPSPAAGR